MSEMNLSKDTSVIIVTYNHINYIKNCLESLLDNHLEIIVVDNKSSDGTPEFIEKNFPHVKVIRNSFNRGYGAGNNLGVTKSNRNYIVIINPDTKVEPNSVNNLLNPIKNDIDIITIPKVLLYDGKRINTCGNKLHFTGMAFTRGEGEKPESRNISCRVNGLSGVCFAITKENYLKLGGFDENIFLYMEDSEISWRIIAEGLKIIYVPESIVYHDYDFKVTAEKIYHVEKGRYIILRKYLSNRELFILIPSLMMTELLTWGYAFLNGPKGIMFKLNAIIDGVSVKFEKIECDKKLLLSQMNTNIPPLNFRFNHLFMGFRKLANFIYRNNRKFLKI